MHYYRKIPRSNNNSINHSIRDKEDFAEDSEEDEVEVLVKEEDEVAGPVQCYNYGVLGHY